MIIAIATTLGRNGSTIIGRIMPLASQLVQRGHQVHVLLLDGPVASQAVNGVTLHSVGPEPYRRTPAGKEHLPLIQLIVTLLRIAFSTARTLRTIKPDIVIVSKALPHNVLGVELWHFLHRQAKIFLDSDDFELAVTATNSFLSRLAIHWAERRAALLSHRIIAATPFLADHYRYLTAGQKEVVMIPTGLEIAASQPASSSTPSEPTILYIGSLSQHSGHRVDLLPDVTAILKRTFPRLRLVIAGSGDDETALRQQLEARGLHESDWPGRFTAHSAPALAGRAHIIIDPVDASIAARAKSSFRVLLAAALGKPVVTSDIGIRPYLLPPALHSRLFAQAGNAADYAAKIAALLNTPLTESEQYALQSHADQYRWSALAEKYEQVIL